METSLYIHIPFCRQKCDYCDFFSVSAFSRVCKNISMSDYVQAVKNEIEYFIKSQKINIWKTIYFGGGTPSQLGNELLPELVKFAVKSSDKAPEEVTVELNPEDIDENLLRSLKNAGVTRISIGIQALDENALKNINRRCSPSVALKALDCLKNYWNGRLSVDFIAGLPGQTYKSFEKQFETIKEYSPDHISLYTLTVEEGTPLYKRIEKGDIRWNPDKADRMWLKGRNILEKNGYCHYEISNFAKPGFESRHNQVYWELKDYIGCGSGASGTLYGKTGKRWTNTADIQKYIDYWLNDSSEKSDSDKIRDVEFLDEQTQEFEFLMMGFRMIKGVSSEDFYNRFGKNLEEKIGVKEGLFAQWKERKLTAVKKNDGKTYYSLNRRGIILLNQFLESLL